jgi:hypothetical protein
MPDTSSVAKDLNFTINEVVANEAFFRRELYRRLVDPCRDIDKECGYPVKIDLPLYTMFWERFGLATRVNNVYPEESWKLDPEVYETEDQEETEFETAWKKLQSLHNVYHFLQRIDKLSGIGHYGVLLIGIDDGMEDLAQPAKGVEENYLRVLNGEPIEAKTEDRKVIYLRCFDETLALIAEYEVNPANPRFGQPLSYNLKFVDYRNSALGTGAQLSVDKRVHWTRVLHIADNRTTSEIVGTPRQQDVFDRLYDLKKIYGGSAEMLWKGGFPGYSFEIPPEYVGQIELNKDELRAEMEKFSNSLQRYMALVGVSAKSLAPQVADPASHIDKQLEFICIAKGIPKRVFMGSEQSQLASSQDKKTWNDRLVERQKKYLVPLVIRPFVDRLRSMGCLPPIEEYFVEFPDLNAPSDDDVANTAEKLTRAMAAYIAGDVQQLMPPMEFLTVILKKTTEEAEAIIEAAEEYLVDHPEVDPVEQDAREQERLAVQDEQFAQQLKAKANGAPKPLGV